MSTIFNQQVIDFTKQPMFFGEDQNVQRYDIFKYPVFDKLTEKQMSLYWRPSEISLQKDRNDYATLRPEQKFIFTSNLRFQTLLDSLQSRGVLHAFLPYCSIPELESCIQFWGMSEMLHAKSYSYIIKNLYSNPAEVFDTILIDEKIIERSKSITKYYDDFINFAKKCEYENSFKQNEYELKKRLYLALMTVNILEGVRFYVSFACSFAFGENKLMEGSAKILGLIARDENVHLSITQNILKLFKTQENDTVMFQVMRDCESIVYSLYDQAITQEKEWAKYIFKNDSIIGLNEQLLCQFIEHITNKRMKAIGLEPRYNQSAINNPLPWISHWLNSGNVQEASQELDKGQYLISAIEQDIKQEDFSDFKL